MIHKISAEHLTIERIGEIIEKGYKLELSDDARQRIIKCREYGLYNPYLYCTGSYRLTYD